MSGPEISRRISQDSQLLIRGVLGCRTFQKILRAKDFLDLSLHNASLPEFAGLVCYMIDGSRWQPSTIAVTV